MVYLSASRGFKSGGFNFTSTQGAFDPEFVRGGGAGILLGSAVTAVYATLQNWPTVVPSWVVAGGITAALIIGGAAGLYPAIRAARVAPTEALAAI